jgi:hypothetical protein
VTVGRSFRRFAGFAALLSAPLAAANILAMFGAVHFDTSAMANPIALLHEGRSSATLWRWAMIFDLLGYYLLIVPAVLVLRQSLRSEQPEWVDLGCGCLLTYSLIGAIGGAVLATAIPPLMNAYSAVGSHHYVLTAVFNGYSNAIYRGMWNLLEELLAGIGWLVLGSAMCRVDGRLGLLTVLLGAACLVDAFGVMINAGAVADAGLGVYLVLAPTWACLVGLRILAGATERRTGAATRQQGDPAPSPLLARHGAATLPGAR